MQTFLTRISYPLRISNCTQQRLQLCTRLGQIRQLQRQQYRNFQQLAILSQKQQQQQQQYADMSTIRPAARVATQKKDVWSTINEAAESSNVSPVINLGQGFFGYNPPQFIIDAAKQVMDRVDCNQYAPTRGRPRLLNALSKAYSPFFNRELDPKSEIVVTSGANEGILSVFMGFVDQGDEVIVFEPYFDQYISNIEMAGGKVVYVPLKPPAKGATETVSSSEWLLDFEALEAAITNKTKMIVINTPHNPIGKIFSRDDLTRIGNLCVKHNIIICSDEVYDRLYYTEFTRIATISPEIDNLTITAGSAGKCFNATGWRVGWLIGRPHLIKYVSAAHTRICYSSVSPLQEAAAIGFEEAEKENYWETSKATMLAKQKRFNAIWDELGLPYTNPEGGYFVLVNMAKVKLPEDYKFPEHVLERTRDFSLAWFLIKELGVAGIPPSEFYSEKNGHLAEDYVRFAVCKDDSVLDEAKERLRNLKKYIV